MNIEFNDNSISIDSVEVSNFMIRKINDSIYEVGNEYGKKQIEFKNKRLYSFRRIIWSVGPFVFRGNTKHLIAILDYLNNK